MEKGGAASRRSRQQMNGTTTLERRSFGETMRADVWWTQPLLVFIGLSIFVVYSTWAAFQGQNYFFGNYVSPFYSPEILGDSPHSWFGPKPDWWPTWLIFSPALLVLWAPGGFRLTCYYYRGAYYKAFWADPPACTVGEPRNTSPSCSCSFWPTMSGKRYGFRTDLELASAPSCWQSTSSCWPAILLVAIRYGIWPGVFWINSPRPLHATEPIHA